MTLEQRLDERRLAVFLFHGVVEESSYRVRNYTRKHLVVDEFERCIRSLAEAGTPLSMDDVLRHLINHEPFPRRSFAVTFDDGFANNRSIAAPILRRYGVPATIYVTTGFVERNAMSWIDRIEWGFERAAPGCVRLPWSDSPAAFSTPDDRVRILDEIRIYAKATPRIDREAMADDLLAQCGVPDVRTSDDPLDRKLTWREVRELAADPLFNIGGHAHHHAILSHLSPEALENEIDASITLLHDKAGVKPCHYAYPEGLRHCYSPSVILTLRSFGVQCCPTAMDGLNDETTDPFQLRRIPVAGAGAAGGSNQRSVAEVAG